MCRACGVAGIIRREAHVAVDDTARHPAARAGARATVPGRRLAVAFVDDERITQLSFDDALDDAQPIVLDQLGADRFGRVRDSELKGYAAPVDCRQSRDSRRCPIAKIARFKRGYLTGAEL